MKLAELQAAFCEAVFSDTGPGRGDGILAEIAATETLSAADHLTIYRNSIHGKLIRALREIYPVCRRLVGDGFFTAMATVFVRRYPSQSPNLGDFGQDFATFVSGFEPASGLAYLPDIAALEWAWHRAFNAAGDEPMELQALDAVSEGARGRIVFRLPVSATLLASAFPTHTIWEANQDGAPDCGMIDIDQGGIRLIVWRQGFELRIEPLDDLEWEFLRAVDAGRPLAELFDGSAAQDRVSLLPGCAARGWLAGFSIQENG